MRVDADCFRGMDQQQIARYISDAKPGRLSLPETNLAVSATELTLILEVVFHSPAVRSVIASLIARSNEELAERSPSAEHSTP